MSEDDPAILDFQLAVTLRLKLFDDAEKREGMKGTNVAMMAANAGQPLEFEADKQAYFNDLPEAW